MYYETDGILDIFTYIDESTGAVPKKAESEYKGHIILLSSMTQIYIIQCSVKIWLSFTYKRILINKQTFPVNDNIKWIFFFVSHVVSTYTDLNQDVCFSRYLDSSTFGQ